MSIRVGLPESKVYHLQASGHCYWRTRCWREWNKPGHFPEPGAPYVAAVDLIPELKCDEVAKRRLCRDCEKSWRYEFQVEIDNAIGEML